MPDLTWQTRSLSSGREKSCIEWNRNNCSHIPQNPGATQSCQKFSWQETWRAFRIPPSGGWAERCPLHSDGSQASLCLPPNTNFEQKMIQALQLMRFGPGPPASRGISRSCNTLQSRHSSSPGARDIGQLPGQVPRLPKIEHRLRNL